MVTRKEVAEKAGVSVSVVSRAMNNSGYVEAEKKKEYWKWRISLAIILILSRRRCRSAEQSSSFFSVRICGIPFISICIREWWKPQGSGII